MFKVFKSSSQILLLSRIRLKCFILAVVSIYFIYEFGLVTHLFEQDYSTKFTYPLDVNLEEILMAIKMGKKPPIEPINTYDYKYRIKNGQKCQKLHDDAYDKVLILYVIKSALANGPRRDAIRKSWGWEQRFYDITIRRVFILGQSEDPQFQDTIDEEYTKHKDIVQAQFIDTYYNNTIKTMMGFKWVIENCPRAQFIMFTDDDMYVSTKNLLKLIRNPFNEDLEYRKLLNVDINFPINPRKLQSKNSPVSEFDGRLLIGYVFNSSPMRHKPSKWYISLAEYPFSKYPPYVTAGAYVMSYPALEDMYYVSMYTKHFKFDDIYIGILAKKCSIEPLHNENFYFWRKSYSPISYKNVIASHGFDNPNELLKVWEEQRSLGHA